MIFYSLVITPSNSVSLGVSVETSNNLNTKMNHFFASTIFLLHLHNFFISNHWFFAGRGIYILYEDVKSCPYEDVHVLWSILVESHTHTLPSLPAPKAWRLYLTDSQLPRIYTVFIHIKLYFYSRVQCKKVFTYFFWFLIYL